MSEFSDASLGEIMRRLDEMRSDWINDIGRLEKKIDSLDYVPRNEFALYQKSIDKEVKTVQNLAKAALFTMATAVFGTVTYFIIIAASGGV